VVFGMPEQAIRLGAASHVAPLERIADYITTWSQPEEKAGDIPRRDKSS
jgi:chemotaxis response regulator CheB